jgi:hypothetical protein
VTVANVITCVNIDLGYTQLNMCPACSTNGERVEISDLVKAVNNVLLGCPATPTPVSGSPTATNTGAVPTLTNTPVVPPSTSTATHTLPVSTATNTAAAPTNTPGSTATNTAVGPTNTPENTATETPTVTPTTMPTSACGITGAGRYTETTTGGILKVSTFLPFDFPAGSVTVQDVAAPDNSCVSKTVIPYPGGLNVPVFCVPALGYTVQVTQTGCGVGIIDSDGGSDLTTDEKGDTSYNLNGCAAEQPNVGGVCSKVCHGGPTPGMACSMDADCGTGGKCNQFVDSSGEIDVTVGDGTPDTCSGSTKGNAMVSIPVNTVTWQSTNGCPDSDGNPNGDDDTIITQFPQTLDLTTDRSTAEFHDNNADGCSLAGAGPVGPYTTNQLCSAAGSPYDCCTGPGAGTCVGNGGTGTCIDFTAQTVTVAGGGTIFSSAAPLHDLLFANIMPSAIAGPTDFQGATCDSPPVIDFHGLAHRCIIAP